MYPNSLVSDVLKVTAGHEAGADLGPVISPASKERIQRLVKSAVDEGADVILDGTDLKVRRFDSKLSLASSGPYGPLLARSGYLGQDASFSNNPIVMICATVNTLTLL